LSSRLLSARALEAALTRHRSPDDPELAAATAARRRLAHEAYITKLLAETPIGLICHGRREACSRTWH
jgi:hypothetical protein